MTFAVLGPWKISRLRKSEITNLVDEYSGRKDTIVISTPNLHHIYLVDKSPLLKNLVSGFQIHLPDGWPVALAASFKTRKLFCRLSGADLLKEILYDSNANTRTVLIISDIQSNDPMVSTQGKLYLFNPGYSDEVDVLADRIIQFLKECQDFGILILCLGFPKQEYVAEKLRSIFRGPILCLGASLDYLTGKQIRSPLLLQFLGLEWCWRLFHDPMRLGNRYAKCIRYGLPALIRMVIKNV